MRHLRLRFSGASTPANEKILAEGHGIGSASVGAAVLAVASLFVLCLPTMAQIPMQAPPAPPWQAPTKTAVPDTTAVLVVTVPCAPGATAAAGSKNCTIELTRATFEQLVSTLAPTASGADRMNFARGYGQALGFSEEARQRGLDKTPIYPEILRMATSQVLAQLLFREVQLHAQQVPEAAIEAYYRDHKPEFEQLTFTRLLIPRRSGQPEQEEADFARKLQTRWAAGEDPAKLQQEADERAGRKPEPPRSETHRRGTLTGPQQELFELAVGKVSDPLAEPGMFTVYKVTDKTVIPLPAAKDEITRMLALGRFNGEMEKLNSSIAVKLNDDYFGPPPPAAGSVPPPQRKR